jgi:hypothetical protein
MSCPYRHRPTIELGDVTAPISPAGRCLHDRRLGRSGADAPVDTEGA